MQHGFYALAFALSQLALVESLKVQTLHASFRAGVEKTFRRTAHG